MGSPTESLRLFIALWPDAATRAALLHWADGLDWPEGSRRSAPEHLHLTLHFLGATDPGRVPELIAALRPLRTPIGLRLGQIQDWGHGLQVLCPEDPPAALFSLQEELGHRLQALGLPVEARPYRPHITLARKAAGLPAAPGPGWTWRAGRLVLAQSLHGYKLLGP